MMEGKIMRVVSCAEEDRISDLPQNLIDSILEPLSVEDAVRTSILSKKWRYRWTNMRALVFYDQFYNKFEKNGAFGHNGFLRIINKVLLLHTGPILKFCFLIPDISIFLDIFEEVDQWMILLSRNGVRELTIISNLNQHYKLPSHLFSCLELTKLTLRMCLFKASLEFEGFPNLEELSLFHIEFGASKSGTEIYLPKLKKLTLVACTNVYNLYIKATNLQILFVVSCPDAMLLRLLHSPCLSEVFLHFHEPIEDNSRVNTTTLAMILSNMPMIKRLVLDGLFFKFWITAKIPKWLPHVVSSLKSLLLLEFDLGDLDQLEGALCFLRNSPNLESLTVRSLEMKPGVIDDDIGPAVNRLESPNLLDCTLNRLETVGINSLEGSRPELLFLKLLLAHSPSLKKLAITPSGTCDAQKKSNICKDVMHFPRASSEAKICYLDPTP